MIAVSPIPQSKSRGLQHEQTLPPGIRPLTRECIGGATGY
jgi:hypothetical protein